VLLSGRRHRGCSGKVGFVLLSFDPCLTRSDYPDRMRSRSHASTAAPVSPS
jgi:hypothetical protein